MWTYFTLKWDMFMIIAMVQVSVLHDSVNILYTQVRCVMLTSKWLKYAALLLCSFTACRLKTVYALLQPCHWYVAEDGSREESIGVDCRPPSRHPDTVSAVWGADECRCKDEEACTTCYAHAFHGTVIHVIFIMLFHFSMYFPPLFFLHHHLLSCLRRTWWVGWC